MSIMRFSKGKKNPYFLCLTATINDRRLSCKAKGLLCYLLSKPDNWYVNYADLTSHCSDGIKSIRSSINELIKNGYLVRSQLRSNNGRFGYHDFIIYEKPQKPKFSKNKLPPFSRKRHAVKGHAENGTLLINDKTPIIKKTATTQAIVDNLNTDAAAAIEYQNKKTAVIQLLSEINIKYPRKIFEEFSPDKISEYATWIKEKNKPMKNPTGFLITAIREKWLDFYDENSTKREEQLWWYKCKICKKTFGRQQEFEGLDICSKCATAIKLEERKKYLSNKKRSESCQQ